MASISLTSAGSLNSHILSPDGLIGASVYVWYRFSTNYTLQ